MISNFYNKFYYGEYGLTLRGQVHSIKSNSTRSLKNMTEDTMNLREKRRARRTLRGYSRDSYYLSLRHVCDEYADRCIDGIYHKCSLDDLLEVGRSRRGLLSKMDRAQNNTFILHDDADEIKPLVENTNR